MRLRRLGRGAGIRYGELGRGKFELSRHLWVDGVGLTNASVTGSAYSVVQILRAILRLNDDCIFDGKSRKVRAPSEVVGHKDRDAQVNGLAYDNVSGRTE